MRLEGSFVWVREREVRELARRARDELGTGSGRARALPDEPAAPLLRGVRRGSSAPARFATSTRSRGAAREGLPRPRAEGGVAARRARPARPLVARPRARCSPRRPTGSSTTRSSGCSSAAAPAGRTATSRCSTRRAPRSSTPPRAYGHVIVDEAQDLTPMQLRMVARRARDGALTMLGDVAQATGPVRYSTLGRGAATSAARRRRGRRRAPSCLPRAARDHGGRAAAARRRSRRTSPRRSPTAPAPGRRSSGGSPRSDLLVEAFREAAAAAPDGLLAVIVPEQLASERPVAVSSSRCSLRARRKASSSTTSSWSSRR